MICVNFEQFLPNTHVVVFCLRCAHTGDNVLRISQLHCLMPDTSREFPHWFSVTGSIGQRLTFTCTSMAFTRGRSSMSGRMEFITPWIPSHWPKRLVTALIAHYCFLLPIRRLFEGLLKISENFSEVQKKSENFGKILGKFQETSENFRNF